MDRSHKNLAKSFAIFSAVALVFMVITGTVALATIKFLPVTFFTVYGESMSPYFSDGDVGLVKESDEPEKGQIIFFTRPKSWTDNDSNDTLVKRIVALPGDELSYDTKRFLVNGKEIYSLENYTLPCRTESYSHKLSDDEFLAFGDNANNSLDSRAIFCANRDDFYVPRKSVIKHGEVLFKS